MLNFRYLLFHLLVFISSVHYCLMYTSVFNNIKYSISALFILYSRLSIDLIIILIVQFYYFVMVTVQVVSFHSIFIVII